ncbi:MAG: GGDEF domain-containing protein [Treponema sp.]|nr:GGDEF domain-containing protein [Treponema sp.]
MADKNCTIGVMIHDSYTDYTKEMISGISTFCNEKNCRILVFPVGELGISYSPFEYQHRAIAAFANRHNLDGLIIATSTQGNHVSKQALIDYVHSFKEIPLVSIGIEIPQVPSILVNCEPGLRAIIKDLIEIHHRKKFLVIGVEGNSIEAHDRLKVIKKVLKEYKIELAQKDIILGAFTYESAADAIASHIKEYGTLDYDAVICLNDDMAFACIDYCKEHGIKIGTDISITGFDDIKRSAYINPSLTSVNQQTIKQGFIAAQIIWRSIKRQKVDLVTPISTVPIFRKSCGCIELNDTSTNYLDLNYNEIKFESSDRESTVVEWIAKKAQLLKMNFFHSSSQAEINLEKFRGTFKGNVQQFDINKAAIVLFDPPLYKDHNYTNIELPEEAYMIAAFDNHKNTATDPENPSIKFNPQKGILPVEFQFDKNRLYYVSTISKCELVYGYIVYEQGHFEELLYEMMITILSHLLSSAYQNTKKEEAAKLLTQQNEILSVMSTTDEMTGLLNRRGFMCFAQQAIYISLTKEQSGIIFYGDMNGLKKINDTYGHDSGDIAIKAEAQILRSIFRSTDIIARIGGDEFCILAPGLKERVVSRIKNNINNACSKWNKDNKYPFELSISLGYTVYDKTKSDLNELMQYADESLYKVKKEYYISKAADNHKK